MLVATGEKSKIWFESLKAFRGVQQACLLLYGLGAMLYDILTLARPDRRRGACYVCFEGGDSLPKGAYGTSLKLSLCMDPVRGIMLAYKQNGEMLHPDHGRPIRLFSAWNDWREECKMAEKQLSSPISRAQIITMTMTIKSCLHMWQAVLDG